VPAVASAANSTVGIGLIVFNGLDFDESMSISLEQKNVGGSQQANFFSAFVGNGSAPTLSLGASTTVAAVRINWDATTHTLSAEYDADGATGGYSWTSLRSFDPSLSSSWSTQSNDVFRVALRGYSENIEIGLTNDVYGDNFVAGQGGGAQQPSLAVSQSRGQVTISWPASAIGYSLEFKTNIAPIAIWNPVGQTPVTSGRTLSVSVPTTETQQFFRLKKP
jgi:hypothetical protein